MTGIFHRHTGQSVSVNAIRSAFVTHLKDNGGSEQVLESVARAMRHSKRYQDQVYDKRTCNQKMSPALDYAKNEMKKAFRRPPPAIRKSSPKRPHRCKDAWENDFINDDSEEEDAQEEQQQQLLLVEGDMVALLASDSTPSDPKVLFGQVVKVNKEQNTAIMTRMVETATKGQYRVEVGRGGRWEENVDSLIPGIDFFYCPDSRSYELRTSMATIVAEANL